MTEMVQFVNHYSTPLKMGYMIHKMPILSRILAVFGSFWFTFWLNFRSVLAQIWFGFWLSFITLMVQFLAQLWFSSELKTGVIAYGI